MAVTAQEGEAFLQTQGMAVTDDDVKTRAQKEKLEEITATAEEDGHDRPKVAREGTMAVTAKEGQSLLGGEDLERTRAQTAAGQNDKESPQKPKITRDSTMAATAQEGQELLEGEELERTRAQTAAASQTSPTTPTRVKRTTTVQQTTEDSAYIIGGEEMGKTRAQTRKMSESDEKEKPTVKRTTTMAQTAKEGEDFLLREAKRAKVDDEGDEDGTGAEEVQENKAED